MKSWVSENQKSLKQVALYVGVIAGVTVFFKFLWPFVSPFVIGYILSLIFSPLVNLLERKLHFPRWLGTLVSMAILFVLLGLLGISLFHRLSREISDLWGNLPGYLASLQAAVGRLETTANVWLAKLPEGMRQSVSFQPSDLLSHARQWLTERTGGWNSLGVVFKLPSLFLGILFTLLSAYFFSTDHAAISAFFRQWLPRSMTESYHSAVKSLTSALGGYIKAQLIIMVYIFGVCLTGFLVIGSPYAFLLAVVTAIVDALPFFGSGAVLWPGALIFLLLGRGDMALGYMIIYLSVSLVRQLVQPKILSSQIGIHPLLSLFSMYLGWKLLGVIGFIIGPIVAVLLKALHQTQKKQEEEPPVSGK